MDPMFMHQEHFLLAGVGCDVPFLNHLITALPRDGYGQVFVEGTGAGEVHAWPGPEGLMPMRVRQDLAPARNGRLPQPGEVLARALRSWADEWLPAPGSQGPLPFTMWIGAARHPAVEDLCSELLLAHPWLHLHRPMPVRTGGH